ncbi:MAG TPA: hypothetical protein VGF44_03150 [Terriglobales bacterium]
MCYLVLADDLLPLQADNKDVIVTSHSFHILGPSAYNTRALH